MNPHIPNPVELNIQGEKAKPTNLHRVKKYYDQYAPQYDLDYETEQWKLYDDLTWYYIQSFLPYRKDIPILDIGGGTGKWAIKLAELGYKVIIGDISTEMLRIAREKIIALKLEDLIEIRILDIRSMPDLLSNSFSLILAVGDVISYAIDDEKAVQELFRICQPGGYTIASVDNKMMYIVNEIKSEHWEKIDNLLQTGLSEFFTPHPIKTYFPKELEILFQSHGFNIIQMIGKPIISTILPKRLRKRKFAQFYDKILELEKLFCSNPAFIGHGGHLQITAQKPL
jgi:ubiquinone/menaquinone biosynthesis C-methylase UbiE